MNIYRIIRLATSGHMPGWLKILGLWGMHVTGQRTLAIFLDPVMACNLRCRMCYFSDAEKRATMHGSIGDERLRQIASALFPRALKLQIGCGAEPTLYRALPEIISLGKHYGVPYISLTTNGQLIATGRVSLERLAETGLNEITLSMHGTSREIYENLMPGATFENLLQLLQQLAKVKSHIPEFKIRVNYTVNSMNMADLMEDRFWKIWPEGCQPDVVQLRPVQNIGKTDWNDFDVEPLKRNYAAAIGNVAEESRRRGVICIYPTLDQLDEVVTEQDSSTALIEDHTYCYVDPANCYKPDFDPATDSYSSYHRKHSTGWGLFKAVFSHGNGRKRRATKKLNYRVRNK